MVIDDVRTQIYLHLSGPVVRRVAPPRVVPERSLGKRFDATGTLRTLGEARAETDGARGVAMMVCDSIDATDVDTAAASARRR